MTSRPPPAAASSRDGAATPAAFALLLIGVTAMAHGAIFARLAGEAHPIVIAAFRVGVATAVVLPFALVRCRAEYAAASARTMLLSAAAGVFLALHFATWIASLALTSIANSVMLVSLTPVWIAIAVGVSGQRRLGAFAALSIGLAVLGSFVIGWSSAADGTGALRGDLLALAGGVFMAGYLMIGRSVRRSLSLVGYIAVCYGAAAALLFAASLLLGLQLRGLGPETYAAMVALGLVSQVIGHSSCNWALKLFSPGFVAVFLLGEPIVSSLLGLAYFGETIGPATLFGGGCILAGIHLGIRAELRAGLS